MGEGLSNGDAGHVELPVSWHRAFCSCFVVVPHWHAVRVLLIVATEVAPGVHVTP